MSAGDAELRARVLQRGWAVVDLGSRMHERLARPWSLIDGLFGPPELLEVQPIRAVPDGRSFASSAIDAPLHTDSQHWRARPPELQLTACLHAASDGGESLLLDGHAVLDAIAAQDTELHRALLEVPRRISFVIGEVLGPTVALRGDRFVFTHSPRPAAGDGVAVRLGEFLASMQPERVSLRAGEALLLDNHRVLHGRTAFSDPARELLRVLAWLDAPLGPRPSWADLAQAQQRKLDRELHGASMVLRRSFGLEDRPALDPRARVVLAMLAGAPPGLLAQRYGVAEPELYRWRDAMLGSPAVELGCADDGLVRATLDRLRAHT